MKLLKKSIETCFSMMKIAVKQAFGNCVLHWNS